MSELVIATLLIIYFSTGIEVAYFDTNCDTLSKTIKTILLWPIIKIKL